MHINFANSDNYYCSLPTGTY